jgi:hypothetical protein
MGLYHLKASLTYFASLCSLPTSPLGKRRRVRGECEENEYIWWVLGVWTCRNLSKGERSPSVFACHDWFVIVDLFIPRIAAQTECYSGKWNEYECIREDTPTGVLLRLCHQLSLFSFNCYCHCEPGTPELYLNNMKTSTHPPSIHCGTFVWL